MSSTVLTCGALRLSVPSSARTPSVNVRPGSAIVEIAFANFTGTVLFEAVPNFPSTQPTSPPPVSAPCEPPYAPVAPPAPTPVPSACYPPSSATAPVATQYPTASAALPAYSSQGFAPVQAPPPPADAAAQFAYASQASLLDFSAPPAQTREEQMFELGATQYPASQMPDSQPPSQPTDSAPASEPLPLSQYAAYMPLTPPSSQEDDDDIYDSNGDDRHNLTLPACAPEAPVAPAVAASPMKTPLPKASTLPKASAKRKLSPVSPEYRPTVKTGKRVRFQDEVERVPTSPGVVELAESAEKKVPEPQPAAPKTSSPVTPPRPTKPSPWRAVSLPEPDKAPERRWGSTFTRLANNTAVLLGGESERSGFFQEMSILDMKDMKNVKWLQNGKDTPAMLGSGRAWHTTTAVDVNLFVFGGEMEVDGERTQTNESLMYDSTYFTWYPPALTGNTPCARAGHCAALVPGTKNILVFGGINGNRWLSDLFILEDLSAWSKVRVSSKSVRPTARSYASLTPASDFLVLFGGNNKTKCFNDVHLLVPSDLSWTEPVILGRCPRPRTGHCAITSKDGKRVIIYGGWDDQGQQRLFYSDVWELRIKSQTECQWTCLYAGDNSSKSPGPRAGASLCGASSPEQKTYLFGGWHQLSYFNDVTELVLPDAPP